MTFAQGKKGIATGILGSKQPKIAADLRTLAPAIQLYHSITPIASFVSGIAQTCFMIYFLAMIPP